MTLTYRLAAGALSVLLTLATATWLYRDGRVHTVTLAAGPATEESFDFAVALARVVEEYEPRLRVAVLETSGSAENGRLLAEGTVDLAMSQANLSPPATAALIAPVYPDAFQLVARAGSGITEVSDLRGRRIAIPPTGSGQVESFWFLVEHYGLEASDFEALPMSSESANWAMLSGAVDAVFRVRAPGNASVRALVTSTPSQLVSIGQVGAMRLRAPSLAEGTIPRGTYGGSPPLPPADLPTAAVPRLLLARDALDPAITTAITRVLFERRRDLVTETPLAGFITQPDPTRGTFIPVHPGAQQYYERDEPSFVQENAEPIALLLSLLALVGSGLLRLVGQRRRRRVDRYNNEVLTLYAEARTLTDRAELRARHDRLMSILGRVVDDTEEGRITDEGFQVFSVTWEAVHQALGNLAQELRDVELRSGIGHD